MRHSVHRVNIKVEKVPEFSAESLCLRQGMVTSSSSVWTRPTVIIRIAAQAGIYFRRSNPRRHFESGSCLNTGSYYF